MIYHLARPDTPQYILNGLRELADHNRALYPHEHLSYAIIFDVNSANNRERYLMISQDCSCDTCSNKVATQLKTWKWTGTNPTD